MAGHTFLGGGIEANPGIFRSGFIYGRFLKPIELDTISDFNVEPVYERKGYALKLGVGKNQNYVDFILFKAKDDPSSLQTPDSLLYKSPGENLVLGLKTRQIILKKISFDADFGASAYTLDVNAPSIEMPDNFFLNLVSGIYTPNQSTEVLFAGNASLGINFKVVNLALKYTRIEPDYKSMGSNYFMTDIENFTINPSFNILKRKLRFNLSYGVQRNNLSGKRDKNALRKIGSGNISYNPNQNLGFTLSYQNYRINQTNYRRIELDTFKLEQFTSNLAFNTNIRFGPRDFLHALRLNVNNQSFKTDQAEIDLANNSSSFNGGINYHYNNKPGKYSIRGGTNFNDFKRIDTKRFRMGWTIGGSKSQMDNKSRILLNFSYYQITLNKQKDGNTLAIRGQLSFRPAKKRYGQQTLKKVQFQIVNTLFTMSYVRILTYENLLI